MNLKSKANYFVFIVLFNLPLYSALAAPPPPYTVVLDPGHGGLDEGTVHLLNSTRVAEKDLTLLLAKDVSLQLKRLGIRAILTRSQDSDLGLSYRTKLANRLKADLFISIHMNSTATPMVSDTGGVETYFLNNTSDATSKRLAYLENSANPVLAKSAADAPEATDVALILKDLRLDANLPESKRLACLVQNRISETGMQKNRGIKQALFHVLLGADMPSILLEAGFLSHPKDRERVLQPGLRSKLAQRIAVAIDEFRRTQHTKLASQQLSSCKVLEHPRLKSSQEHF